MYKTIGVFLYTYISILRPRSNGFVAKVALAKILKKKGLSKYKFAQLIGMQDRSNLVRCFKPGYDPRLSTLEKWAKALDVSVKDLIED